MLIDTFIPADGIAKLPIADEDDNAEAANCGKPADTYAAARFGSVPIVDVKYVCACRLHHGQIVMLSSPIHVQTYKQTKKRKLSKV